MTVKKYLSVIALLLFSFLNQPCLAETVSTETLNLSKLKTPSLALDSYKLTFGFERSYYKNEIGKDSLTSLSLTTEAQSKFSEKLKIDASVTGIFEQESSQNLSRRTSRREFSYYLNQARLNIRPTHWFNLDAGSLDQSKYMSPLIANGVSFPAVRETFEFDNDTWRYTLSSQQAIPTSQELSAMTNGTEPLPSYYAAAFSMTKAWPFGTRTRFIPGLYRFSNLPAAVSYESCLMGNTADGECAPNSNFAHEFFGTDLYTDVILNLPEEWVITASANYLKNFNAPLNNSQGILFELDFFKGLNSSQTLGWTLYFFEKQSDVTPAFYSPYLFENNRKGFGGSMKFAFSQRQAHIKTTFLQASPLKKTTLQNSTVNFVSLSLQTTYDNL